MVTFTAVLRSIVSCCHGQKLARGMYHSSIRRRALGFLVLQFWLILDWSFSFCVKKLWFFNFLHFGLQILRGLAFDFRFLSKMQMVFGIFCDLNSN